MFEGALRDLRFALRQLGAKPLSNALAVLSLAVAIGAGVLLYSTVNAMLLRPAAGLPEPERLIELGRPSDGGLDTVPYPLFDHVREHGQSFEHVFAYALTPLNLALPSGTERTMAQLVSGDYFAALRVVPAHGRLLNVHDDRVGAAATVAVASDAAFQRYFGGDVARIGQSVRINGQNLTLIGVAPRGFRGHIAGIAPDFFLPLTLAPRLGREPQEVFANAQAYWLLMGGRLAAGASVDSARTELDSLLAPMRAEHADDAQRLSFDVQPMRAIPAAGYAVLRWFAVFLFLLVAIVLMVACGNVAGLLVARAEQRKQEIAMRFVLGARRGAVLRQLLCEAGLLAGFAGAIGMLLAQVARAVLLNLSVPAPVPITLDIPFDAHVLWFAAGMVAVSTLLAGLAPAWRASSRSPQQALAGGVQTLGRGGWFRDAVVVGQVAFTLVLLIVAGLFVRALDHARGLDPGFRVDGVAVADFDLEPAGYDQSKQRMTMTRMLDALAVQPGIASVAAARAVPLSGSRLGLGAFLIEGREPLWPDANVVAGDFFRVMDIAVRGRTFSAQDTESSEPVVVVNLAAARALAPDGDVLGKQFRFGDERENKLVRVIGVTPDGRYSMLDALNVPFAYFPYTQVTMTGMNLMLRTDLPPGRLDAPLAAVWREVDADLPAAKSYRLADMLTLALLPQRIARDVAGALGVVGLLLAALGLYGLLSSYVASRTREIGLRLALGAEGARVRRDVARRALRLIAWGLLAGFSLALGLSMALSSMLFGLEFDPLAFLGGLVIVFAITALASWEPARRAARVSPMVALRYE